MLKITQTNSHLHLLFQYYVILPYKDKRARKIRDPSTVYCPGLIGLQPADAKGATIADRISRGYFGYFYLKIEAKITFFFRSKIINLSFNGLTYNMGEHIVHC